MSIKKSIVQVDLKEAKVFQFGYKCFLYICIMFKLTTTTNQMPWVLIPGL